MRNIPAFAYHSAKTLKCELQKIFCSTWNFVCHKNEIKQINSYVVRTIGKEEVLIVRKSVDSIVAYLNLCPHRSAKLVNSEDGQCKGQLLCPYHAWTFNLDGELIKIPSQDHYLKDLNKEKYKLTKIRCDEWSGLVFVNFNSLTSPLKSYLGEFPAYLKEQERDISTMELITTVILEEPINWKIVVENYVEDYHFSFVHPKTLKSFDHKATQTLPTKDHVRVFMPYRKKVTLGRSKYPWSPAGGGSQQGFIWPNMTLQPALNHMSIFQIVPLGPEITRVRIAVYQTAAQKEQWPMNLEQLISDIKLDMEEDFSICRDLQHNTHSRYYKIGVLSKPHELGIEHFANTWWSYMDKQAA
ncbi:aromatic ring-hydroxylating dioxygenase subunit alpha [Variovorax humicola]|uniref:Aromatic ring-hydroxylating dioxygenase subunit alpha n=1 Tax=Variovorax humicola TaxID=1769758 RepID=A0ABU8VXL3_9BURK